MKVLEIEFYLMHILFKISRRIIALVEVMVLEG